MRSMVLSQVLAGFNHDVNAHGERRHQPKESSRNQLLAGRRPAAACRFFHRDFFAFDKADHAAILEYASGKWWSRR